MAATPKIIHPSDLLRDVREKLGSGETLAAFDAGRRALQLFPGDLEIAHATVLALARAGGRGRARELLSALGLDQDSKSGRSDRQRVEIASLAARLAKDDALRTADPIERTRLLKIAASRYQTIYANTADTYPGVNAATLWLLAGEPARAHEVARAVLQSLERSRFYSARSSYYLEATEAEAKLVCGDVSGAAEALAKAKEAPGCDRGSMATTRRQMRLVCRALEFSEDVLDVLTVGSVLCFADIFTSKVATNLDSARIVVQDFLKQHAWAGAYVAIGSEFGLMVAEAALESSIDVHVFLPFADDHLLRRLYELKLAINEPSQRVRTIQFIPVAHTAEDGWRLAAVNRLALGSALFRAKQLDAAALLLRFREQPQQGGADVIRGISTWMRKGLRIEIADYELTNIDIPPLTMDAEPRGIVLLTIDLLPEPDSMEFDKFVEILTTLKQTLSSVEKELLHVSRIGAEILLIFDTIESTISGLALLSGLDRLLLGQAPGSFHSASLEFGVDFGPVALRSDPLTRLIGPMSPTIETARILLRHAPPGAVFASELFTTHAVLAEDHQVDAEYVGIIGDLDVESYCLYFNR